MAGLTRNTAVQLCMAYLRMAAEARYRPAAPSDGCGNSTVPLAELDINAEALDYAQRFSAEEDAQTFNLGCCDFPTRPAAVFAIEAVRCLMGCEPDIALRLLRMAVAELSDHPS